MKFFVFAFAVLCSCSCAHRVANKNLDNRKVIVCTTGIIADAVSQFADSAEVVALMGAGTDPHLFKPTKATLDDLSRADIIVANGLHLEGRMQDVLEKFSRNKTVIFMGAGVESEKLLYGDAALTIPDPHIWMDAALWANAVAYLATEMSGKVYVNPDGVIGYIDELLALNEEIASDMQSIPQGQRVLITAHDAFQYFGKAYDVEVVGLQGISTQSDYGIRDVTNMVDLLVSREIKAVFVESSISERSMKAVAEGAAQRDWQVALGGTLYTDALGPEGSGADTYLGLMHTNSTTIVKALK